MRQLILIVWVSAFSLISFASSKAQVAPQKARTNLKKEMRFGEQLVNGKFQLPGDSSVEIENEKPVFNLLQIRTDFNDRRLKETTRD